MQNIRFHKACFRGFSFTEVKFFLPHICRFISGSIFTWRKYMATVAQISDPNSNEIEWLANHLGHSVDIHQEYYRLRDNAIELSKVSRLLLAADSGKGETFRGKRLDEIQIDSMISFYCISSLSPENFHRFHFFASFQSFGKRKLDAFYGIVWCLLSVNNPKWKLNEINGLQIL